MQRDLTKADKQGGRPIHKAQLSTAMAARRLGATRMRVRYLAAEGRIAFEKGSDGRLYFSEAEVARVVALGGVDALALPAGVKLTAAKAAEIKQLLAEGGVTYRQIAVAYGVSGWTISQIARGETWPDVAPAREVA